MKASKTIWFPAKRHGWGWRPPNCWQGRLVMLLWVLLLFAGAVILRRHPVWLLVCIVSLSLALVLVCFWKGEKPRWHWGKD